MSKKILTSYDFNGNELQNALAHMLASDPGSPDEGQFWWNSTSHVLKVRSNSATQIVATQDWVTTQIASAGGGDMLAATYDPNSVNGDAFDMDNMVEGTNTKILTSAERSKLAAIEANADVTDATNVASAGAIMDGDFSTNGLMKRTGAGTYSIITDNSSNWNTAYTWGDHSGAGYLVASDLSSYLTSSAAAAAYQPLAAVLTDTTASFTTALLSKLNGIEASADVTDAANVASAGAVMDSDFSTNGLMKRTAAGTYAIVTDNSSNWNTAFGWGDHSGLYANASHTHTASEITDFATAVNTQVVAYWDSIAGTDANVDTIREVLDLVLANASALADVIGRYNSDIGDGSSTSIAVTHSLNSLDVVVAVYQKSDGAEVECDIVRTSANVVTLGFSTAPALNSLRIVVKK